MTTSCIFIAAGVEVCAMVKVSKLCDNGQVTMVILQQTINEDAAHDNGDVTVGGNATIDDDKQCQCPHLSLPPNTMHIHFPVATWPDCEGNCGLQESRKTQWGPTSVATGGRNTFKYSMRCTRYQDKPRIQGSLQEQAYQAIWSSTNRTSK